MSPVEMVLIVILFWFIVASCMIYALIKQRLHEVQSQLDDLHRLHHQTMERLSGLERFLEQWTCNAFKR